MTRTEFVLAIEDAYREEMTKAQQALLLSKLSQFTEKELSRIFHYLLEHHSPSQGQFKAPFIGDVYDTARQLGIIQTETSSSQAHIWKEADCEECEGEGRLAVFYKHQPGATPDFNKPLRIVPLHKAGQHEKPGEAYVLFRCHCIAGQAESIPRWKVYGQEEETCPF